MSKQDKDTGNVHQLHRDKAAKIEPPDGYTPPAGMYMQAAGGVPLVRLFDVFEWLQRDGRMPAKAAAAAICDVLRPLEQEACEWLFTGLSNDYARPVDAQAEYCDCGRLLVIDLENYYQRCSTCPPGVDGLLKIVSSSWVNGPEYYGYGVGLDVCLPQAKAHELWAWGRSVKNVTDEVQKPAQEAIHTGTNKVTRYQWTSELRERLSSDFDATELSGVKAKWIAVGAKWGIGWASVKKQLGLLEKSKKATFATGMGKRAGSQRSSR